MFLLLLAVSGIALNHSSTLGLDTTRVDNSLLLDAYGIQSPDIGPSYTVGNRWLTQAGERLYLDDVEVDALSVETLVGAVAWDGMYIAVGADQVVTISEQAGVVDRAAGLRLPGGIESIGSNGLALGLLVNGQSFAFDPISLELAPMQATDPMTAWSQAAELPTDIEAQIVAAYRGSGVSVERVLVDLHSGRLFGLSGVVMMDLAAIALCLLAISGILVWFRR